MPVFQKLNIILVNSFNKLPIIYNILKLKLSQFHQFQSSICRVKVGHFSD